MDYSINKRYVWLWLSAIINIFAVYILPAAILVIGKSRLAILLVGLMCFMIQLVIL